MEKKQIAVGQLAEEAGIASDDALILLWDVAQFRHIESALDKIPGYLLRDARRVLGIPARDELVNPIYWQSVFGMSEGGFGELLRDLEIFWDGKLPHLPKGAVSKLKIEYRKRKNPTRILEQHLTADIEEVRRRFEVKVRPWKIIGKKRKELYWLSCESVLGIHRILVNDYAKTTNPILPPGCRGSHLLASALYRPQTSNGGELKYPTVEMAAASLLYALVNDHPFHNGNKRTALVAMVCFLDLHDMTLTCNGDSLFKLASQVAMHRFSCLDGGRDADYETFSIANWISENSRQIERDSHPVPFWKLKQRLMELGCVIDDSRGGRGKINISRIVFEGGTAKKKNKNKLHAQMTYYGEGREADRSTIKDIRHKLQLDEQHNIDARTFYFGKEILAEDFITKYKKTLDRLAKY
jgi:death-on-curing family protein